MRRLGWSSRTGCLVIVALCLGACPGKPSPRANSSPAARCPQPTGIVSVGERIPAACELEHLNGGLLRLGDLAGKPAVINFWATWCTFCIDEMPAIDKTYRAFRNRVSFVGADLLGVDGETRGAAQSFARRTGVTYPLVYDRAGVLYAHFSAQLIMPITIYVRANGVVAHRQFGPLNESTMRSQLRRYLGVR